MRSGSRTSLEWVNRVAVFLFVGAHMLILGCLGSELLGEIGPPRINPALSPAPAPAPSPDWRLIIEVSLLASWGLALLYSVIVPIIRRRLDLLSIAGSMYIAATMIVEAALPDGLRSVDSDPFRFYVMPVTLPSLLVATAVLVGLPRGFAQGLCRACGYDRRGIATDALCPECGAKA